MFSQKLRGYRFVSKKRIAPDLTLGMSKKNVSLTVLSPVSCLSRDMGRKGECLYDAGAARRIPGGRGKFKAKYTPPKMSAPPRTVRAVRISPWNTIPKNAAMTGCR